jgi:formate dehydrogenase subunit delta
MSAAQTQHLIKMANQIAANFAYQKDEAIAAQAVADHIQHFWSPLMKKELLEYAARAGDELHPLAQKALHSFAPCEANDD